jgi:hypothetical protein
MTEAEWLVCEDPWRMLETTPGTPSLRHQGLWAAACCHRVWHLLPAARRADFEIVMKAVERSLDQTGSQVGVVGFYPLADPLHPEKLCGNPEAQTAAWVAALAMWSLRFQHYKSAAGEVAHALAIEHTGLPIRLYYPGHPLKHKSRWDCEQATHADLLRDIFGNPFRPVTFSSSWRTDTALTLARQMYDSREFSAMPILADALQDAGCDNDGILTHCRGDGPHVRGCWVVDLVLGKE